LELKNIIERSLVITIPAAVLAEAPSIQALCATLDTLVVGGSLSPSVKPERELASLSELPLTYAQARFFEHDYEDAHQWNLANPVMTLTPRINPDSLDLALGVLVRRHEALRVRFDDDHRQFLVAPEEAYTFHEVDLS